MLQARQYSLVLPLATHLDRNVEPLAALAEKEIRPKIQITVFITMPQYA